MNINSNDEYNIVINRLQDYMLTNKNMVSYTKCNMINNFSNKKIVYRCTNENNIMNTNVKNNMKTIMKNNKNNETDFFFPTQKDSLFWCLYIITNGVSKYEEIPNFNVVVEKKEKIDYINILRQNKDLIKKHKISSLVNIESNLVNDNEINLKTFLVLCLVNKLHILYISKKTYFEFNPFEEEKDNIDNSNIWIITNENNKYGYYNCDDINIINNYRTKLFKIENIDKPVKGFSSYRSADLLELCNKLGIESICNDKNKKKTNKELYELLLNYFI